MLKLISSKVTQTRLSSRNNRFFVQLANSRSDYVLCQTLRHKLTKYRNEQEDSANLHELDRQIDAHCQHIMVMERDTGKLVATTRILAPQAAKTLGHFIASKHFNLDELFHSQSEIGEIDILYIDFAYKTQPVLQMIWQGICGVVTRFHSDYLIASDRVHYNNTNYPLAISRSLNKHHSITKGLNISPLTKLTCQQSTTVHQVVLPSTLASYVHLGAVVCSDAHHCPHAEFADFLLFIDADKLLLNDAHYFVMGE